MQFVVRIAIIGALTFLLTSCASDGVSFVSNGPVTATIQADLRKPDGPGPFPAVVIMHGCQGLAKYPRLGMEAHADFFVRNGYVALIPDSVASRRMNGDSICRSGPKIDEMRAKRMYDAFAALDFLQAQPFVQDNNVFLVGHSNGAGVAVRLAGETMPILGETEERRFAALAAYYPACRLIPWRLNKPLIVLTGAKDDWTPPDKCRDYLNRDLGAEYSLKIYDEAYHSFVLPTPTAVFAGHTVAYNAEATADSRRRMLEFFEKYRGR